ncbi:OST-HTH/LOTUS domain-containing protein [Gloeothece verrucosa]|uniref:HTH OST-type domain-containing protein n=1 Tax=Gloeothece verrucosa (strain PCC 7822) TaxID=497965 RepID=E0U5D7_GLOV7|nr:OST-HTH/LOTUS domain-containing protein [Gloeothece verrucosa]ADN13527.1 hypothetical protein Cyan7822_1534 [Gloeothece verrucosa PCC 7822]
MTSNPTLEEIKTLIDQLPITEQSLLLEDLKQRVTLSIKPPAEISFQERKEEENKLLKKQKKYFLLLGISIYEGQQIEIILKHLSRFTPRTPDEFIFPIPKEDFFAREKSLEKKTLGFIFNKFKNWGMTLNEDAQFMIDKFIEERNQVVHHIFKVPGFHLYTEEGIDTGIKFLEQYRETIECINELFAPILYSVYIMLYQNVKVIEEEDFEKIQKKIDYLYSLLDDSLKKDNGLLKISYHEMNQNFDKYLDNLLLENFETHKIDKSNLQQEKQKSWQKTKIIEAVRDVSKEIADQDGWVSLSACCQEIRKKYPEIKPEKYGFNKFLEIIESSNLFEIKKNNHKNKKIYTVYFRFLGKNII